MYTAAVRHSMHAVALWQLRQHKGGRPTRTCESSTFMQTATLPDTSDDYYLCICSQQHHNCVKLPAAVVARCLCFLPRSAAHECPFQDEENAGDSYDISRVLELRAPPESLNLLHLEADDAHQVMFWILSSKSGTTLGGNKERARHNSWPEEPPSAEEDC